MANMLNPHYSINQCSNADLPFFFHFLPCTWGQAYMQVYIWLCYLEQQKRPCTQMHASVHLWPDLSFGCPQMPCLQSILGAKPYQTPTNCFSTDIQRGLVCTHNFCSKNASSVSALRDVKLRRYRSENVTRCVCHEIYCLPSLVCGYIPSQLN